MVIAFASVRRVVRVACGWLLLHACALGTAGAASLVELDRDGTRDRVLVRGVARSDSHVPLQSVGLLAEVDSVEKQVIRRDLLPPARSPSPVGSPALCHGLRLVRPVAAVPICPRPPPRTV